MSETISQWVNAISDDHEVRLAVREGRELINREQIMQNRESLQLAAPDHPESRYSMTILGDKTVVEQWDRYVFEIDSEEDTEDLQFLLEVPSGIEYGDVPWQGTGLLTIESDVLALVDEHENVTPVGANRVAGLEAEKNRLQRFLRTQNSAWGLDNETGIILEGPPGTGKTELVIEVCQERYGEMPTMISGPEILSKWVGESERMLRNKFDEARNSAHQQPVLYIDELDAIARTRSEASEEYSAQIVAQLLVLLDGVEAKREDAEGQSLRVIASTNLSHVIDPALRRPGRLGDRPIQFERPNQLERNAILHHYLEEIRRSEQGMLGDELKAFVKGDSPDALSDIVADTEGFTGADLEDLIQETVSQVQKQQADQVLSRLRLESVLAEEFEPTTDIKSETFTRSDLESTDQFQLPVETKVHRLDTGTGPQPTEVARSYFEQLFADRELPDGIRCKYRELDPADFLEADPVRAKENIVEAFQHAENERICLYIRDARSIAQARVNSSLVEQLIGVINEQLLAWHSENILLLDEFDEDYKGLTEID